MTLFKKSKPFISFRVYMCVAEDDTETANRFNLEWDKYFKTWYLDGDKYAESKIANLAHIKSVLKPFRAHGQHQQFL